VTAHDTLEREIKSSSVETDYYKESRQYKHIRPWRTKVTEVCANDLDEDVLAFSRFFPTSQGVGNHHHNV
jgi:hypothetical protein